MIERTEATFGIKPEVACWRHRIRLRAQSRLARHTSTPAPYIPVIDKSQREDGTFSREDFIYDAERDTYTCPAGKTLATTGHVNADNGIRYIASVPVCRACPLKPNCCPNMPSRRIVRDVHEAARDVARALAKTKAYELSRHLRKKVEMLFSHLKRILRLDRLRLRGPNGAQFEFTFAAIAQNLPTPRQAHRTCAAGTCVRVRFVSIALWHSFRSVASRAFSARALKAARLVRSVQRQRNPVSAPTSATKSAHHDMLPCGR